MLYRLFTPAPELADIVACYWHASIASNCRTTQQYNTPLFEGLVFNLTQLKEHSRCEGKTVYMYKTAYFLGQAKSYTVITGSHEKGGYIIGVRFKPLGLAKITGINMVHLANQIIDAEDIWGNELAWLCEAMQEAVSVEKKIMVLEHFLKKKLRAVRLPYRADNVAKAIHLMKAQQGNVSSAKLQDLINISKETLERAFLNFHGLHPKLYSRMIRFNHAKKMMNEGLELNLTDLASRLGYFDQSHFIKEFKRFSGQIPTQYLKTIEEEKRKRTIPVD